MPSASAVDPIAALALGLAILLVCAKLAGHVALRLGAPAVLGELAIGIVLGNLPGLSFVHALPQNPGIDTLARLGVLILVFEVGLELTIREVFEVGLPSILVAVLGTAFTFALGFAASAQLLPDAPRYVPVFLGASLTATSIGITARVLKDLGRTRTREARIIIGAAVADDVIGLVVLTVVSGWITAESATGARGVGALEIGAIVLRSVLFLAIALYAGSKLAPRLFEYAARLRSDGALLGAGLTFCFLLAWAASAAGLAAIIGAFTAGLILEDSHSERFVSRGERSLADLIEPISSILVPVFFVVMGMRTEIGAFFAPGALVFALVLALAAVLGKLACALGAGRGVSRLTVALGMVPRGEVTLVFASLGAGVSVAGRPLLDARTYSSLVVVVVLTTLITPGALKWSLRRSDARRGAAGEARA